MRIIVSMVFLALLLGCSNSSIEKVKAGAFSFNSTKKLGEIVEQYPFFKKPGNWVVTKTPNGTELVAYESMVDLDALKKTCDSFYFMDHANRTKQVKASLQFALMNQGGGFRFYDAAFEIEEQGQAVRKRHDDTGEILKSLSEQKPMRYCEWIFE